MWLTVGSSSSFIDVMGHVGMFGVSDHITSLSSRSLLCIWNPNLSGPKSRWVGADFGPKPLKRPGPGNPVPASVGRRVASQELIAGVRVRRFTGVYRRGWSFRQTTSRGAALKIELYVPDTMPI